MLAGIITPPIIIAGSANFDAKTEQYLVSTSLSKFSQVALPT
jgi:NCS2 family nucleobase:cation symporter-2